MTQKTWRASGRQTGYSWESPLWAYWEVLLDPICDDFTPEEVSAGALLRMWATLLEPDYPDGLIPIYWFVEGDALLERMPFQYPHQPELPDENFLTFNTWPVDAETDKPLNWFELPVVDKIWTFEEDWKGGFIQQETGWKPAILQPFVYLPALLKALEPGPRRL